MGVIRSWLRVVTKDYTNLSSSSLLTLMAGAISVLNVHACTRVGQRCPFRPGIVPRNVAWATRLADRTQLGLFPISGIS